MCFEVVDVDYACLWASSVEQALKGVNRKLVLLRRNSKLQILNSKEIQNTKLKTHRVAISDLPGTQSTLALVEVNGYESCDTAGGTSRED